MCDRIFFVDFNNKNKMIKDLKHLHYEVNWFTALFSVMSKEIVDGETKQPVLFFKMTWGSKFQIFTDKSKTQMLIECRKPTAISYDWDVFDVQGQEKKIATITMNLVKSMIKFGAESWNIKGPDGGALLTLDTDGGSTAKRIFDNMSGLYNPTHKYVVKGADGADVATFSSKHGLFKGVYDFVFAGGTEDQKKVALALFAAILLMMKK